MLWNRAATVAHGSWDRARATRLCVSKKQITWTGRAVSACLTRWWGGKSGESTDRSSNTALRQSNKHGLHQSMVQWQSNRSKAISPHSSKQWCLTKNGKSEHWSGYERSTMKCNQQESIGQMSKRLAEIRTASHLMIELIKQKWRKSINQYPIIDDAKSPYFHAINIEKISGKIFDKEYTRRVDLYPQGESLNNQIGLTALIDSEGKINRWEIFRHYSGCYPLTKEPSEIELSTKEIRKYLENWQERGRKT